MVVGTLIKSDLLLFSINDEDLFWILKKKGAEKNIFDVVMIVFCAILCIFAK